MKAYNFNAGPCVLPKQAIESAIEAIRDFDNTGIGILEILTVHQVGRELWLRLSSYGESF